MSYISALNLLEDPSVDISENTLGEEELALWANAQFTFDVQPGSEAKLFNDQDFYAPIAPAPIVSNHKVISSSVPMPSKKKQTARLKDAIVEDDKRKRNTAASARFRLKKKMREQTLKQQTEEMEMKARQLEERVKDLEREAAWLRALVLEKNATTFLK